MGQGQEFHARRMIFDAMSDGGWVLLQNIHLSLPFCTEAMDALIESSQIHDSFRLWMTTEVHPQFPIGLLQVIVYKTAYCTYNCIEEFPKVLKIYITTILTKLPFSDGHQIHK